MNYSSRSVGDWLETKYLATISISIITKEGVQGSPVSAVVINFCMEFFAEEIF